MQEHTGTRVLTLTSGGSVVVVRDYAAMSLAAADIVASIVADHPGTALTLPTGETPRGMYEELVTRIRNGDVSFDGIDFFCLDDYLGKSINDETSLTSWLDSVFFTPANLHGPNLHFVPTLAADPHAAAMEYERTIESKGGLELAVLGLGPNGHIGFNEPGSPIDSRTRVVELTPESRNQNAAYYDSAEAIPDQAMTIGIGTLLEARRIVLIVSGAGKASILRASLQGPITSEVPGSYLQTVGDRLTVIADTAAVADLDLKGT
ncbi:MAG TPA: glucosamine-6-phosphate deaminase [Thermomicrobiales bacterium]|nr:glucosamine-6-phosphate deaminase [Thermomicrobiales bacterium]